MYSITAIMKVKTVIFTSITESLIGRAILLVIIYVKTFTTDVNHRKSDRKSYYTSDYICLIGRAIILVIIYVKTFTTDVIVFTGNVMICLMSHWSIIFSIGVGSMILKILLVEVKGKMTKYPIKYRITVVLMVTWSLVS